MDNLILATFSALILSFYINQYSATNKPPDSQEVVIQTPTMNYLEPSSKVFSVDDVSFEYEFPNVSFNIPEKDIRKHHKQIECLADNIFHESKGESRRGQYAVAFVTMNRLHAETFPDTVCGVVKQRTRKVCQFSWYCDPKKFNISKQPLLTKLQNQLYNDIYELAKKIYFSYEKLSDPTQGALFFHANYVNPYWKKSMMQTAIIGNHIFYALNKN